MNRHRELAQMMRATAGPPAEEGLVGWWKFDEGAGSEVLDYSGNNLTATSLGPVWVNDATEGMCLHVTNSSLLLNSDLLNLTGPVSILARVRLASSSGVSGIITRCLTNGSDSNSFDLRMRVSTRDLEFVRAEGIDETFCITTLDLDVPANQWTTVAVTTDSGIVNNLPFFRIDNNYAVGSVSTDFSSGGETGSVLDANTRFGSRPDGAYVVNNYYADLRIYDRALSQAEVMAYTGQEG